MSGKKYNVGAKQLEIQANGKARSPVVGSDLEAARTRQQRKPVFFKSVRYYVIVIALVSPFVSTFSKVIINFALIDMIDPEFIQSESSKSAEKSDPSASLPNHDPKQLFFEVDNSCPTDSRTRERLIAEMDQDIKRAKQSAGEKFPWDTFQQGLLKAAYSIGHATVQIPCGRLSEIYGSHWVMSLSALFTGICCFLAPWMAATHFYLLFVNLVTLGVLGSAMTPALLTLFTNWLTKGEKEFTFPFYLVTSRLGYALSSVLCGLLMDADLSWRYVFFTSGAVSLIWSILFIVCARSRPIDHPLVSDLELHYLASKNKLVEESINKSKLKQKEKAVRLELKGMQNGVEVNSVKKQKPRAPWLKILTNLPVWAFIITKFCVKLSADTVSVELPTYLKRVMHFSAKDNGYLNGWNYVIFCIGCLTIGTLAKVVVKRAPFGVSKTFMRKLFQSIASFGVSLCLIGIAFSVCDRTWTRFNLFLLFFLTTFGTGGEAQIPLDITDRYAGTIHALGSSIAISGAIEPTIVGFILRGKSAGIDSWKLVWLGASGISFFGGLVFLFCGDASIQAFNSLESDTDQAKSATVSKSDDGTDRTNTDMASSDRVTQSKGDRK